MRKLILMMIVASVATPAWPQESPPPSVEDYVCTFSGDCGEQEEPEAQPQSGQQGRVTATRGFALSRPDSPSSETRAPVTNSRRTGNAPRQRRPSNLASPSPSSTAAVPAAGPGQRVNLRLNFVTGSATLTPAARAHAEVFARSLLMPQLRNMRFLIEGHTDSVGTRERNIALSQRRAQALADFLAAAGVTRDRLEVRGHGPDRPLPNLPSTAGENRRVEAVRIS